MPAQINFQQGEDVIIELEIQESGAPVDITDATTIRAQLFVTKNNIKNKMFSYSLNTKTGYGTCKKKSGVGNENILQIIVKREESVSFDEGILSFAVVVTSAADSDFPNGISKEYNFNNVGAVLKGDAKDEVIP